MPHKPLDDIRAELQAREPIFHRREFGTDRAALERMTAAGFWEIGASGTVYDRTYAIETMLERYKTPEPHAWPCHDFRLTVLGADLYQIAYVLEEPGRTSRRSTLWRWQDDTWKMVFHQGTVVA